MSLGPIASTVKGQDGLVRTHCYTDVHADVLKTNRMAIVNPYNPETEPASHRFFEETKRPALEQAALVSKEESQDGTLVHMLIPESDYKRIVAAGQKGLMLRVNMRKLESDNLDTIIVTPEPYRPWDERGWKPE